MLLSDRFDQRFGGRRVADVKHRPIATCAMLRQACRDRTRTGFGGRGSDNNCAGARELIGDGPADAARCSGDQSHFVAEAMWLKHVHRAIPSALATAASVSSRLVASLITKLSRLGTIRLV